MNFIHDINNLIRVAKKNKDPLLDIYNDLRNEYLCLQYENMTWTPIQILDYMKLEHEKKEIKYKNVFNFKLAGIQRNLIDFINQYLPEQPSEEDVMAFLESLNMKKALCNFQEFIYKCREHFGISVNNSYIAKFIKSE